MNSSSKYTSSSSPDTGSDGWREFYLALWPFARYLVYSFAVPSWHGQENDIIEDIVQETARRFIERSRKAERGEAAPIRSPEVMVMVIASNYYKDMKRRDRRLMRMLTSADAPEPGVVIDSQLNFSELATENVYREKFFKVLAQEIVKFPDKQRTALLTDLASRMCFEAQPTPLQQAFLDVGIDLQKYRQILPTNLQDRARYASLLTHAYKRITRLTPVQQFATSI
jgi:DNA-directed RNA polymerase specialized sigma24 family protein